MQGRALTNKRMTRTHQGNTHYTPNAPYPNETTHIIEWGRIRKKAGAMHRLFTNEPLSYT
jgi:hypothetical protein